MPSCVTEETADASVLVTQGAGHRPPHAVYTARDIDRLTHATHSHTKKLLRALTKRKGAPSSLYVGLSNLINHAKVFVDRH